MNSNIEPPKPPLTRIIREGGSHFCNICKSTTYKVGFLGLFGERLCDNNECVNSKSKKIVNRGIKIPQKVKIIIVSFLHSIAIYIGWICVAKLTQYLVDNKVLEMILIISYFPIILFIIIWKFKK
jgi:hypothetical protein